MKVRIRIREQLCLLIAITSLLALMVLALSTWFQSRHYLRQSQEQTLQVTANLKADQVAQNLRLFQDSVQFITTRDVLQAYVRSYNNGNTSQELRDALAVSVQSVSDGAARSMIQLTLCRIILTRPSQADPKSRYIYRLQCGRTTITLDVR